MKAFYLVATIVGYAATNALMAVESVQTGNEPPSADRQSGLQQPQAVALRWDQGVARRDRSHGASQNRPRRPLRHPRRGG